MYAIHYKDFYKTDHRRQYPVGTDMVYSNFTPRTDKLARTIQPWWDGKIVWFGLQAVIVDYLVEEFNRTFFKVNKDQAVRRYKQRLDGSLGPDAVPMDHIEELHDLGFLPLRIKSLPEGARVNMKVPVFTITNTIDKFYWLVNDLETVLSSELWKPTTVATLAFEYKKILTSAAITTGVDPSSVLIQAHDFSFRGMSGRHDATMCGMGHLLSFIGTDTIPAIDAATYYYGAGVDGDVVGVSVPATEHSVMCMGTPDGEIDTFRRLINDLYPKGIVSIVSDTWDFWKVITEFMPELRQEIRNREADSNGLRKVVLRPDSGDPVKILTGLIEDYEFRRTSDGVAYPLEAWNGSAFIGGHDPIPEHVIKGAVECLWDIFGGTVTDKGFRVLDECIGLIYGDSITLERADEIMHRLIRKNFASCNVVLGVGSYSYQYHTRDSFGFAMKATCGSVNGELREIFKDPATDSGAKKSAKGLLRVELEDGEYVLYDQQTPDQEKLGELKTVFEDGKLVHETIFPEIRARLDQSLQHFLKN